MKKYSHTQKVGRLGRYGPRIGRKLRNEIRKIEEGYKKRNKCPYCGKIHVKRKSSGIWLCSACKMEFAGGAFLPVTGSRR